MVKLCNDTEISLFPLTTRRHIIQAAYVVYLTLSLFINENVFQSVNYICISYAVSFSFIAKIGDAQIMQGLWLSYRVMHGVTYYTLLKKQHSV